MESFTSNQKLMQDCSLLKYLQRFFGFVFFNIILFAVCQHKEVKPQSSADLRVFVSGPLGEFTRFKLLKQFEPFAAVSLLGCNQQSLSGSIRSSGATSCQSIQAKKLQLTLPPCLLWNGTNAKAVSKGGASTWLGGGRGHHPGTESFSWKGGARKRWRDQRGEIQMHFSAASDAFPLACRCGGKKNQRKERAREEKALAALIHPGPWISALGSVRSQAEAD